MVNLKEAIKKGKLKEFIKQNSKKTGDKSRFDAAISSMAGKSKAVRGASKKDSS